MKFILVLLSTVLFINCHADNWQVGSGGKSSRNSLSNESGPEDATLLWQNGYNAIIAQQAVIDGNVVAMSRIFNLNDVLHGTKIVAQDLYNGDTLWTTDLPVDFPSSDWRSRVSAFKDGVIYATRSGNTNYSYMYALDAMDGSIIWQSEGLVNESSTESTAFEGNGDLIVGNFSSIIRIDATDGSTVWETNRSCPTSNGQEVAVFDDMGYYWEASGNGPKVSVVNLETGNYLYSSDGLSPGLIQQLGLFVGPEGTIYAPRTMNNPTTDFLFALKDTGSEFEELWNVALGYVPFATFGTGPDGSIYSYSTNGEVVRIDHETGTVLNTSDVVLTGASSSPRMAIDANGYVFVTNGEFASGAVHSFNPDLTPRWSENITNVNIGGPAIGENGTMIICGVGTNVRAYQGNYSLIADFTSSSVEICPEEFIQFFDNSNGNIIEWEWYFEGGVLPTSFEQNPVVYYPDHGTFDVSLIVSDGTISDTLYAEDFIYVIEIPDVTFDELPEFCLTDPAHELTEGNPYGGEYYGTGVLYGHFVPALAGIGEYTLSYIYTDENGCGDTAFQIAIVTACTGIKESENNIQLEIIPNPANQYCYIELLLPEVGNIRIELFDNLGNVKIDQTLMINKAGLIEKRIELSQLESGIYFVRITCSEQIIAIKKLIVY